MFVNGVQVATTPRSTWNFTDNANVGIGCSNSGTNPFTGYISNLRFIKGTGVYSGTFTPPTAPTTAVTNTKLLLNFTNAGIYDAHASKLLETVGNVQINTNTKKYSQSMSFDGTGDWLITSGTNLTTTAFKTGDFTIETWVYRSAVGVKQYIFDSRPASTEGAYATVYVSASDKPPSAALPSQ